MLESQQLGEQIVQLSMTTGRVHILLRISRLLVLYDLVV